MNPSVLNRSRAGYLLQAAMFALVGGLLLLLALDAAVELEAAQAPPIVTGSAADPTPGILFDEQVVRRQRDDGFLEEATDGRSAVAIPVLLGMGCLMYAVTRLFPAFAAPPLLSVGHRELVVHGQAYRPARTIPLAEVRAITFGRADRVADDSLPIITPWGQLGAKLGARLRYRLRVDFADRHGPADPLILSDIEVDGGRNQLRAFAQYLSAMTKVPLAGEG